MSHQDAADSVLAWLIHPTSTTELEGLQDSILPAITAALVTTTSIAWKTAQHFSYGARGFMRVPVSVANDLNFLLYEPRRWIETPLLWPTEIWLFLHGRELKEETPAALT